MAHSAHGVVLALAILLAHVESIDTNGKYRDCDEVDDNISLLQHSAGVTSRKVPRKSFPVPDGGYKCLNATSFFTQLKQVQPWKKYSQGNQDSILANLFHTANLGTTNKHYVEFGYCTAPECPPNTGLLAEQGWTGLELDGGADNPAINLHKEFITSSNIVSLFDKYGSLQEPDYVSVDIDSCDLWVFLALTKKYRPRVVSVEYNSKYALEESRSNKCKDSAGNQYSWNGDDMYGVSLRALHSAAEKMGYTMVAVEPRLDVFLVRQDLVCEGSEVDVELFREYTGLNMGYRPGTSEEVSRWVQEYHPDILTSTDDASTSGISSS